MRQREGLMVFEQYRETAECKEHFVKVSAFCLCVGQNRQTLKKNPHVYFSHHAIHRQLVCVQLNEYKYNLGIAEIVLVFIELCETVYGRLNVVSGGSAIPEVVTQGSDCLAYYGSG